MGLSLEFVSFTNVWLAFKKFQVLKKNGIIFIKFDLVLPLMCILRLIYGVRWVWIVLYFTNGQDIPLRYGKYVCVKAQVHSKNNILAIEPEKSDKPIKKSLSKIE